VADRGEQGSEGRYEGFARCYAARHAWSRTRTRDKSCSSSSTYWQDTNPKSGGRRSLAGSCQPTQNSSRRWKRKRRRQKTKERR
jgi:hypothetical protein